MWKHVRSEKALKTYGWAVISGFIFFGSGLLAGAEVLSLLVATGTAVALKTPFYWLWEHAFEALWGKAQEPKGYLKLGNATARPADSDRKNRGAKTVCHC